MKRENVNRRDFNRLTVAAMGGLMAGSFVGCGEDKTDGKTGEKSGEGQSNVDLSAWTGEHVCRGLNACKGEGKGGKNACAGQGECATVEPHSCGTENTCKNLGGCGPTAASNSCKGEGGCQVPLMKTAYETAYKKFKADMEKAGKADKLPKEPPGPPMPE
ncbi:MAG: hypothetical protein KDA84_05175 [Planctomycetaceae bacterium]|nr:hypothetical protein [Planctomycetaceae bacterium]